MKKIKIKQKHMSPVETKRQPCEVYSRVCGYLRPVKQWNDSKQSEFAVRKMYTAEKCEK